MVLQTSKFCVASEGTSKDTPPMVEVKQIGEEIETDSVYMTTDMERKKINVCMKFTQIKLQHSKAATLVQCHELGFG
jgi:hypothetical protein